MPVIGFLDSGKRTGMDENSPASIAGWRDGLRRGRNLAIEYRWAEGHYDRLPALAADLSAAGGSDCRNARTAPARAAKAATSTIPIVFQTGSDPVTEGLVASLNRPGGNVTGATRQSLELNAKRLGLLIRWCPRPPRSPC